MKGNFRDILIGLIILALVLGAIYLVRRSPKKTAVLPTPTPISSFEQKLQDQFNFKIPDNLEKAELADVSGGQAQGIATRSFENGKFETSFVADLSDPAAGYFYEGWLVRGKEGDANFDFVSAGIMRIGKGGYLLDFESNKDLRDYKQVVITLEKVNDNKPEKHILEGSF